MRVAGWVSSVVAVVPMGSNWVTGRLDGGGGAMWGGLSSMSM